MTHHHRLSGLLLLLVGIAGCATSVRRFPLATPRWEDPDRTPFGERPDDYYSGLIADGADKLLFRPLPRLFYFPLPQRARNVNAVDEVPNSSWWTNRIGVHDISPARAAEGACADVAPLDPEETWTVVEAKPNGANPGFFISAPSGRYLLKFDGRVQPQRATSADVIGSRFYWTAGYHAPCNQVVYFDPSILEIAEDATTEDAFGNDEPISQEAIDTVLDAGFRLRDGRVRASASVFLPGRPIGPFEYEGTRSDDPNDRVDHQHRRELRGNKILAAWLNHHDAREQNSLDVWIETGEDQGYLRHYMIDFGDCFGGRFGIDQLDRRTGHSYFADWGQFPLDFFTLGIYPRPWYHNELNEEVELFGYFTDQDFVATDWRTDYPNAAFIKARYDDELWMARIIARFTDEHIRAIVDQGELTNARHSDYLVRTLIARRDRIVEQYFTEYTSLDRFRLVRREEGDATQSLCFEDIAIQYGVADPRITVYKARFYGGVELEDELGWLQFQPDPEHPHRSCIQFPIGDTRPAELAGVEARDDDPLRYGVLKIWMHQRPTLRPTSAVHLHFYDLGAERGYRLVGIERPDRPEIPDEF